MSSPSRNVSSRRYRDVTLLYFWLMENHFTDHHKSSYYHMHVQSCSTFLTLSSLLPDNTSFSPVAQIWSWHSYLRKGTVPKLTSVHNQIWTKRGISCIKKSKMEWVVALHTNSWAQHQPSNYELSRQHKSGWNRSRQTRISPDISPLMGGNVRQTRSHCTWK